MGVDDIRHLDRLVAAAEADAAQLPAGANRRRFGRLMTDQLYCSLGALSVGPVLDLSAGGVRMYSRAFSGLARDDVIDVTLVCGSTRLPLRARVAWTRRAGLMRIQVGLEFINPDPQQIAVLQQMATLTRRVAG